MFLADNFGSHLREQRPSLVVGSIYGHTHTLCKTVEIFVLLLGRLFWVFFFYIVMDFLTRSFKIIYKYIATISTALLELCAESFSGKADLRDLIQLLAVLA